MQKNRLSAICLIFSFALLLASCGKKEEIAPKIEEPKAEEVRGTVPGVKPKPSEAPITEEKTLFSFERGYDGFEIPFWAEEQETNVGKKISLSKNFASDGNQSLCLIADFPGKVWTSALVELEQYLDFTPYREIALDVYIPEDTPLGLRAKILLTVGEDWKWTEMSQSTPLSPGAWTTLKASLEPGTMDWRRTEVTDEFRADVRKIMVRIESNRRPIYSGPIYIDNIRIRR